MSFFLPGFVLISVRLLAKSIALKHPEVAFSRLNAIKMRVLTLPISNKSIISDRF